MTKTTILKGDCLPMLRTLPDECVHCVVTSPPYWGLRDYGVAGQIGLEPTLGAHLDVMVAVFTEVRRVLRADGTVWLNYGDCYATTPNGRAAADVTGDDRRFRDKPFSTVGPVHGTGGGVLKPKDLCMMPNRVAIALQESGWWVRSEIIWHKPNPMPESVTDRPASAHEKIYLLSKSQRYFYDAAAVREPATGPGAQPQGRKTAPRVDKQRGKTPRHVRYESGNKTLDATARGQGRHCRNVWTIATRPFPEAHFATFPPALVEPCIKAGCPAGGTVLDPFGGAGTVGLVANRLGRDAILIELNPDYIEIARQRINRDAPLFSEVIA